MVVRQRQLDVGHLPDDQESTAIFATDALGNLGQDRQVRQQALGQVVAVVALAGDVQDALGALAVLRVGLVLVDLTQRVLRLGAHFLDPLVDQAQTGFFERLAGNLLQALGAFGIRLTHQRNRGFTTLLL